jgi:phospholipase C
MYLMAATSHGYAYPPGTNTADQSPINVPTIFDSLTTANITWKIYATDNTCTSAGGESGGGGGFCTYLTQFTKYNSGPLPSNVVDASQFLTDVAAGTLPSVSFIEPGYLTGQDEHPSSGTDVKTGAAYVASLINGLMNSPSWKDSAFILTYDEAGGMYDHVLPQPMPSPDGISPVDLTSTDTCYNDYSNPLCNFQYTGYRVPLLVVSPYTKKNYISHTVMDYTAILKLIETRFSLQPLTQRDAAQPDMTEFFDFQNVPWATPPSNVPSQPGSGACNAANLGYSQPE